MPPVILGNIKLTHKLCQILMNVVFPSLQALQLTMLTKFVKIQFCWPTIKLLINYYYHNTTSSPLRKDIVVLTLLLIFKGNESDVGILILSYRFEEVTNSYVLHCFRTLKNSSHLCNQMYD